MTTLHFSRPASIRGDTGRTPMIRRAGLALALIASAFGFAPLAAHAAAPAGSQIGNQASATYSDASAVTRTVTSNTVVTTVQQVASLSFAAATSKTISPGGQVYYPHTLVNTGNGTDSFALAALGSGSFAFSTVQFFADANGDGIPDNSTSITSTGLLAIGQAFNVVVAGAVPPTAVIGNTNTLSVTAASVFNAGITAVLADVATVTGQAVINVTQAIDVSTGAAPAGPRTITLTYTNTGNATATVIKLGETVPSGMTYVPGSARWSGTGAAVVLTDADATDNQAGVVYDFGVLVPNRVNAVIASLAPGASGSVSFKVNINAGLPAGASPAAAATASYAYFDGAATLSPSNTNTVQYTVAAGASVTLTGATVPSAAQGGTISFVNPVTNTGNGTDSFDITTVASTFPIGTTFQMFQADGVTPLTDSNGNGIPDTGPLAPAAVVNVVVRATLPPAAVGGPFTVQARAASRLDATQFATATDTLTAIALNTVDLTNDTAGAGAPGFGPGPGALAVATLAANPGATVRFTLVAANGSGVADSFNLQASTDATFATAVLPAGWSVVFRDAAGAVVSGSGVVTAGSSRTVYADVSVPAGAAAGLSQLYFRALSPTTGAADSLHDAVNVNTVRTLVNAPNNTGQVTAGGTVVYTHIVSNTGNVLEGDGLGSVVTVASTDSAPGFSSVVYWDRNNDGTLDASDPVVTTLGALVGGTNGASTAAGLSGGETARFFVKVTAPAAASIGTANTTTLTLATSGVINGAAAAGIAIASDSTGVIAAQIALVKMQALDAACDGTADTPFSVTNILVGAAPGGCIRYEITALNAGVSTITGLIVSDATPPYTTYSAVVPASVTAGTVTTPANGASGTVQATVGPLAPGQSVVLRFGVRIQP